MVAVLSSACGDISGKQDSLEGSRLEGINSRLVRYGCCLQVARKERERALKRAIFIKKRLEQLGMLSGALLNRTVG